MELSERFWSKVDRRGPADCWPWLGAVKNNGYGNVFVDGKTRMAHQVAFELSVGSIPLGAYVLHSCDNRRCVNPRHLRLGDHDENMRDMVERRRSSSGSHRWNAKLSEEEVLAIRAAAEKLSPFKLAKQLGMPESTIRQIALRKRWIHL